MLRASKILVATDLSEPADEAVRQAHAWAKASGGELHVCHALPESIAYEPLFSSIAQPDPAQLAATDAEVVRATTARVAQLTGRDAASVPVRVVRGSAGAAIVTEAEALGADLIVVGSRGLSTLDRLLLGSVAERVVRHAHCPVLVARTSPAFGPVLAATDFSPPSSEALSGAAIAARWLGAGLALLHAVDTAPPIAIGLAMPLGATWVPVPADEITKIRSAARDMLDQVLAKEKLQGSSLVVEGHAKAAIIDAATELSARLVVVGTTGRTGLARFALGSVAEGTVRGAPCSVLVLRRPAA